ncbi:MAG TPA: L,D-transpeptidase family protein [Acidimicrobiales bacterium]|nr:L,D-transpeptidase family protein [Acidimicrobiales bacterium]
MTKRAVATAVMALSVAALVVVSALVLRAPEDHVVIAPTTTTTRASTTTSTSTSTTTAPPPTTAPAASTDVAAAQSRLQALGYWLNDPAGTFGSSTRHAVVAFEKVSGLPRDGALTPATLDALARAARPVPRSAVGHHVEIDRARQVLFVVTGDRVDWVFDTSTGKRGWTTPAGNFAVTRQIDGYHRSPLGVLYRPKYFVRGIALHGYPSVPAFPASHGCVRVVNAAMDFLWSSNTVPVGTPVLVT